MNRNLKFVLVTLLALNVLFPIGSKIQAGPPWFIGDRPVPGPLPPSLSTAFPTLDTKIGVTYGVTSGGVKLLLDFAKPQLCRNQKVPLVIYVHGGWWVGGSRTGMINSSQAKMFYQLGFAFASIDYRLTPAYQYKAIIGDCKLAVRYLRANTDLFGIDGNRIGIWGGSAGGHLVSLMGTAGDGDGLEGPDYVGLSSRPSAVVNDCGITDLTSPWDATSQTIISWFLGCSPKTCMDKAKQASPAWQASSDDPPVMTFHGDHDPTVSYSQAQTFAKSLQKAGNAGVFIQIVNGNHGFGPYKPGVIVSPNYTRISWLRTGHIARYIEPGLRCDLNMDGQIDLTDVNEFKSLMGLNGFGPDGTPTTTLWNTLADLVPDGKINYKDWQSFCAGLDPPITIEKTITRNENKRFEFRVTVKNTGNLTLTDLLLTDFYPKELTLTGSSESTSSGRGSVFIKIPTLIPNEQQRFTLSFSLNSNIIIPDVGLNLENRAMLSGAEILTIESKVVFGVPGISVRKFASKSVAMLGDRVEFTVVVSNPSKQGLTNVLLIDAYPKELEFISARPQGVTSNGKITFEVGVLDSGESQRYNLIFKIVNITRDSVLLTNTVQVTSNECNPISDSASLTVKFKQPIEPLSMKINWKGIIAKTGEVKLGQAVSLEIDPDGGSSPYLISINWGDKSKNSTATIDDGVVKLTHSYENLNDFNIIITCSDRFGSSYRIERIIHVK